MNNEKRKTKLKLLYLVDILKDLTDESHPLNSDKIIAQLVKRAGIKAERKSIYTDLKALQEYGYDIVKVSSGKKGVFLGSRKFELPEARLLIDAVRSAGFITAEKTTALTEKILSDFSVYDQKFLQESVFFSANTKTTNSKTYYYINDLAEAISQKKKVRLSYYKFRYVSGEAPHREKRIFTLTPYALIWSNDRYYAICNRETHDNFMQIRVDRIVGVEILEEPARDCAEFSNYTDGFDVVDYIEQNFNGFSGKSVKVELLCSNLLLDEVKDRFGQTTPISFRKGDRFVAKVHASDSEGFLNWVNQFGDKMLILNPPGMKEKLKERAATTLALYKSLEEKG